MAELVDVKLTDNSDKVGEELEAAVLRALTRIGMKAEGYAKPLCPVDTGLLRNSITYALSGQPAAISSYKAEKGDGSGTYSGIAPNDAEKAVYIGSNVQYAPAVELGALGRDAQPFLKPAIADHLQTYRNIVEDELKNG